MIEKLAKWFGYCRCFACRRFFKSEDPQNLIMKTADGDHTVTLCPECAALLHVMKMRNEPI